MDTRNTEVQAYQKRDGTVVSKHTRRIRNRLPFLGLKRKPSELKSLLEKEESSPFRVAKPSEISSELVPVYDDFDRRKDKIERFTSKEKFHIYSSLSGLGILAASVPLTLVFPPALIVGVAASAIMPFVPHMVKRFRSLSNLLRRKIGISRVLKKFRPPRKDLKNIALRDGWDSSSLYAKRSLREKLFGTKLSMETYDGEVSSTSRLIDGSVKVSWKKLDIEKEVFFTAGGDLSGEYFSFPLDLRGANLRNINMEGVNLWKGNFDGANLEGANLANVVLESCSFRDANLQGTDFTGANLRKSDMSGADITGAEVEGVRMPRNLMGVTMSGEQFDKIKEASPEQKFDYPTHSFDYVVESLGISEKRFEYLVISGVIEVRDNSTQTRVVKGFDPNIHHVPGWSLERTREALKETSKSILN